MHVQVRIQEAPEHIPEGDTPQTCSMCAWEGIVDVAKPGDRVEVTGIYRAVPLRVNPKQRLVTGGVKWIFGRNHFAPE